MNRLEFLKELKDSLVKTVQYVNAPIIEEKIEKVDLSLELFSQIEWLFITNHIDESKRVEEKFINGMSILLVRQQGEIRAFSGVCPSCGNLLIVISRESKCKCMHCEMDYLFSNHTGNSLLEYPVKITDDGIYTGLLKKNGI